MNFDREDSASIATRHSAISHSFVNRMNRNGIVAGERYSGGGGGEGG